MAVIKEKTRKPIIEKRLAILLIIILTISIILIIKQIFDSQQIKSDVVPEVWLEDSNGNTINTKILESNWNYNGEISTYKDKHADKLANVDFSNLTYDNVGTQFKLHRTHNYKITRISYTTYSSYDNYEKQSSGNYSEAGYEENGFLKDCNIYRDVKFADTILYIKIDYLEQGSATYVVKLRNYGAYSEIGQKYLHTNRRDPIKLSEFIRKLDYSSFIESINFNEELNSIIVEYKYYPTVTSLKQNAFYILTCVDDLDRVIFSAKNNKVIFNDINEMGDLSNSSTQGPIVYSNSILQYNYNVDMRGGKIFLEGVKGL